MRFSSKFFQILRKLPNLATSIFSQMKYVDSMRSIFQLRQLLIYQVRYFVFCLKYQIYLRKYSSFVYLEIFSEETVLSAIDKIFPPQTRAYTCIASTIDQVEKKARVNVQIIFHKAIDKYCRFFDGAIGM